MKLSILIPVFNEEKTITKVLDAVAKVDFGDIKKEIIVINDGSTDMETCYKLFPTKVFQKEKLQSRGFELEPEITAKLIKKGYKIHEVPITTNPRGYEEGKKLHAGKDGIKALAALIKYRFI